MSSSFISSIYFSFSISSFFSFLFCSFVFVGGFVFFWPDLSCLLLLMF